MTPQTASDQADAKLAADLAYWTERATWTDAQFLAEYCADKRREAETQAGGIRAHIATDKEIEDEIRRCGGNEEG